MLQGFTRVTVGLIVLGLLSGCASVPPVVVDEEAPMAFDDEPEKNTGNRTRNTLLTIGGILVLGAILANEIEDNTRDAVRDAARP